LEPVIGNKVPPLVQHLESYFGSITGGFSTPDNTPRDVQVIRCARGTLQVVTTLGLSRHPLKSVTSPKTIRQEIFMMVKSAQFEPRLPAIIHQVAAEKAGEGVALLRGEVVHKAGFILDRSDLTALYTTLPVYYPKGLCSFKDEELGEIVFSWLLPITSGEETYIRRVGWFRFEELLDGARFDLYDLDRPTLVS